MKIELLIELLQNEQRLHPCADVVVSECLLQHDEEEDMDLVADAEVGGVEFDGQQVLIIHK